MYQDFLIRGSVRGAAGVNVRLCSATVPMGVPTLPHEGECTWCSRGQCKAV